jgi:hypothetical protein
MFKIKNWKERSALYCDDDDDDEEDEEEEELYK